MKKFMLLPLVAAIALTACTNNSTSESATVSDANTSWQSEVQQTEMPASMTSTTYSAPQQTYSAPQQTYSAPQQVYSQPAASYGATETVGNCQVIRGADNAPVYSQMQKGCYTDSTYTVGKSDTVYLVSFLTGTSVSKIASLNNLSQPYQLRVGQSLRVR
ncbi:hypothetical protein A1D22_10370 [Pasteurellaceae bacterium LFhippo2]|nr:hypothetical protein [Pasteurellaceae bacterium LFhippo2]